MKRLLFISCLLAFSVNGIFAQSADKATKIEGYSAKSPEDRAKEATDRLGQKVKLTPEQYNQILDINIDFYRKVQAGNGSLPPVKASSDRDSKVKALLTPAQVQKLDAAKAN